ncbi:MAG: glycosyltransferase [Gemmatimonadetes bacterium]|nr:glycosyltransferase [Gemmatimonadota bacterium]
MTSMLLTIVLLGLLLQLGYAHRKSVRALRSRDGQRPSGLAAYPPVTVIRPVKGVDVEQEANFRAALDTGYPGGVETIFVLEDEEDPAYPLVRRAIEYHAARDGPGFARIVLAGRPPAGRTGKINNMIVGEAEARGEIIVFGDSDTRPDTGVLTNLVEHIMADDSAGAGFAPVVNPCRPRSAGDVGYAIILNAYLVGGMETALGAGRSLPFLMGQTMAFRRSALRDIGGVKCADGQLVDDMYLGARIVDAGYTNVMGTHPLHVINHGLGFKGFLKLWRRWLFCGRGGIPSSFALPFVIRALSYFTALGLALGMLVTGHPWLAALAALVLTLEGVHYVRLHRLVGGARVPLRHLWMAWMPYPTTIPIGLSMLLRPELDWRGHTYRLDRAARLRSAESRSGEASPRSGAPR